MYPGIYFKDSCETEFIYIKPAPQSLADGNHYLSVWGETPSTKSYRAGDRTDAEKSETSPEFFSAWLDDTCGNTAKEMREGQLTFKVWSYHSGE